MTPDWRCSHDRIQTRYKPGTPTSLSARRNQVVVPERFAGAGYPAGMDPAVIGLIVAGSFAVLVVVGAVMLMSYNGFIRQRHMIAESWRQVDVELRRRHDLIPRLIEVTRAAAEFEQATMRQVIAAQERAVHAHATHAGPVPQAQAEAQLGGALHGLLAAAGPRLRASQAFLQLGRQLAETEDRIAAARRFYNGNVRSYNARVESVPSNIAARLGGFVLAQYFEVDDPAIRAAPPVALTARRGEASQPTSPHELGR